MSTSSSRSTAGEVAAALNVPIPPRHLDRNLLVATWNLRAFGRVTEKWRSESDDSPRRDLFDLRCIAEIVSRFDVVAIEEAREDLSAFASSSRRSEIRGA
jgi:hypothetical protein